MSKLEDLEKLKQLKDMGAITEIEFEKEKNNILNSKAHIEHKTIKIKSKIFFVLATIFAVIAIIFSVKYKNYEGLSFEHYLEKNSLESLKKVSERYEKKYNELVEEEKAKHFEYKVLQSGTYIFSGITIISLATGIVLKVKEKKESE